MVANFWLLLSALSLFVGGCAATSPMKLYSEMHPVEQPPEVFSNITDQPGQVNARISLRAPGLKGRANGIIRHAQGEQYLIELYARGDLFLKIYFTDKQTVLWPTTGVPEFFDNEETPSLSATVSQLLPNWRLDDVLPIHRTQFEHDAIVSWKANSTDEFAQRIYRTGFDTIYKTFSKRVDNASFPFQKVSMGNETGTSVLTWSLRPYQRNSH